jgi:hypothetical protein
VSTDGCRLKRSIAKADELLKTNADAYFRDPELQELALEARERQFSAPPPEPGVDHEAIERRVAQQEVDRFSEMLRKEPTTRRLLRDRTQHCLYL